MQGKRIHLNVDGKLLLNVGDYGKSIDGVWFCRTPNPDIGMGNLSSHDVIEHEDGTITVSPSILVDNGNEQWHGYLERGVWRQV